MHPRYLCSLVFHSRHSLLHERISALTGKIPQKERKRTYNYDGGDNEIPHVAADVSLADYGDFGDKRSFYIFKARTEQILRPGYSLQSYGYFQ